VGQLFCLLVWHPNSRPNCLLTKNSAGSQVSTASRYPATTDYDVASTSHHPEALSCVPGACTFAYTARAASHALMSSNLS
jgi:hypothetical protein